jgi:hypothetical protein
MSEIQDSAKELLKALADGVKELATLRIITAVCPLEIRVKGVAGATQDGIEPKVGEVKDGIVTIIDLVQGDVKNFMTDSIRQDDKKSLFDFHASQVTMSRDIIAGNIKALADLARGLIAG